MPFKSEAQRKKCWLLYNRDLKAGRVPKWDCNEWEQETKKTKKTKKTTRKNIQAGGRKRSRKSSKK